jgi:hypothetical protein
MRRAPALLLLFLFSSLLVLRAQCTNASVTGRVTNPSKAFLRVCTILQRPIGDGARRFG